jgi:G3E family GTPase
VKPIPVRVLTGPLGCGKTTAIAALLAGKPPEENWVVLLNEFTDAGIDALTVAAAARGVYDVRLVPGGCLCCTGDADFRRNLRELIDVVRPARILVEPSGIGHPTGIVEELLAHESAGQVHLEAVVTLVDPPRLPELLGGMAHEELRAAVDIADVLVLSKADLASSEQQQWFKHFAASLYPPKFMTAQSLRGAIPAAVWHGASAARFAAAAARAAAARRASAHCGAAPGATALTGADHDHDHAESFASEAIAIAGGGERQEFFALRRHGARWIFPRQQAFSRTRLLAALGSALEEWAPGLGRAERIKAAVRVAEDEWLLVQRVGDQLSVAPSAWRRDNRLEVLCAAGVAWKPEAWDALWQRCLQ